MTINPKPSPQREPSDNCETRGGVPHHFSLPNEALDSLQKLHDKEIAELKALIETQNALHDKQDYVLFLKSAEDQIATLTKHVKSANLGAERWQKVVQLCISNEKYKIDPIAKMLIAENTTLTAEVERLKGLLIISEDKDLSTHKIATDLRDQLTTRKTAIAEIENNLLEAKRHLGTRNYKADCANYVNRALNKIKNLDGGEK